MLVILSCISLFKPDSTTCELEAVTALQNCIADIKTWTTNYIWKLCTTGKQKYHRAENWPSNGLVSNA